MYIFVLTQGSHTCLLAFRAQSAGLPQSYSELAWDLVWLVLCMFFNFWHFNWISDDNSRSKTEKGQIYGLLGASGCGKTSLLSVVVGRRQLNSGLVQVMHLIYAWKAIFEEEKTMQNCFLYDYDDSEGIWQGTKTWSSSWLHAPRDCPLRRVHNLRNPPILWPVAWFKKQGGWC